MTSTPLPTDEDGHIETSASYGQHYLVRITYNTDPEGNWVDGTIDDSNQTLHGPFFTEDEAGTWIEAYPDGDTDVADMDVICFNRVRPDDVEVEGPGGVCFRHDGPWGGDETCVRCVHDDGTPRSLDNAGPLGPGAES